MRDFLRGVVVMHTWLAQKCHLDELRETYRTARLRVSLRKSYPGLKIQHPIRIEHPECVEFGRDVSVAAFVHIWGGGGVRIGDRVLIGSHCAIASETHDYAASDMHASHSRKPVVIEDDAWLGTHAAILPGVTIGKGAVVGAGAVVTKDVEPGAIVAGVPAKIMAYRPVSAGST